MRFIGQQATEPKQLLRPSGGKPGSKPKFTLVPTYAYKKKYRHFGTPSHLHTRNDVIVELPECGRGHPQQRRAKVASRSLRQPQLMPTATAINGP